VIQDEFILTEKACAVFIRQICEALDYIHSKSILHLDMKPENVMCVSKTGNRVKIIDFGLARFYDPAKKLQVWKWIVNMAMVVISKTYSLSK
jgi:myosin-light-chain kinase